VFANGSWLVVVQSLGLLTIVLLNCVGMTLVSKVSGVYLALTLLPFVVQMFTVDLRPSTWVTVPATIQYDLLCNSILWNFKGWGTVAMYSGEVHNASRTFPIGVAAGALAVCVIYVLPLLSTFEVEKLTH
jgi:amino acid transporter